MHLHSSTINALFLTHYTSGNMMSMKVQGRDLEHRAADLGDSADFLHYRCMVSRGAGQQESNTALTPTLS